MAIDGSRLEGFLQHLVSDEYHKTRYIDIKAAVKYKVYEKRHKSPQCSSAIIFLNSILSHVTCMFCMLHVLYNEQGHFCIKMMSEKVLGCDQST